jgi:hypothetical protein
MKRYILLALGLAAVLAAGVSAQQSNNVPFITATMQTNVVVQVQPLVLTSDQMSLVISNLQSIGISGNVPISTANLQRLMVVRRTDGSFLVTMQVH